jgi:hypothetical protein
MILTITSKLPFLRGLIRLIRLLNSLKKTAIYDELTYMAGSTFSRLTNDRDYRAVVRLFFELLHSPQLYHQRGVQRKRFDWLDRAVIATDATNLTIIPGVMREPTQFEHLQRDVEVFADLDSPVHVFDRGYLDYSRFCDLKERGTDFICLLQADARAEVLEHIQDVEITNEQGTRHLRDEQIELAETGERFRRIIFEDIDGEKLAYLTTLSSAYAPVEVMNIYTLRTMIEIFFRELKQYTSIENFHSRSLNGVLFEIFCTLIGYLLIEWFHQRHPLRGGVPEVIRTIRTRWNTHLRTYG